MDVRESKIRKAIAESSQERSKFQLHHFVLGQHDTLEMVYYQCLLELDDLLARRDVARLEREKLALTIQRLAESDDEVDRIDAKINQVHLDRLETALSGTEREIAYLVGVWEQLPKFSREEIEAGQEEYWALRLKRQAEIQVASESKVSWAQVDALLQAKTDKLTPGINRHLELSE